jgi:hypothetical protein
MKNRDKQDVIPSWCQLVQQYETDGNRNVRIKRLESALNTVFHCNHNRGWHSLLVSVCKKYETDVSRNVGIKMLESVINTVFHRN